METIIYVKETDLPGEGNWRFYWRDQSCLAFMSDIGAAEFAIVLEEQVNLLSDEDVKAWIETQNLSPAV